MLRSMILLIALGCTGSKVDDSGNTSADDSSSQTDDSSSHTDDSTSNTDDTGHQDTNPPPTCNDDNEECAPGVSGCGGEGANMLPGADCLECHSRDGDREAPIWTAGGTLFTDEYGAEFKSGATVKITDSTGQTVTLTSSSKGNFYTSKALTPPLSAEVTTDAGTLSMDQTVDTGACNSCHKCDGEAGGKMYAP